MNQSHLTEYGTSKTLDKSTKMKLSFGVLAVAALTPGSAFMLGPMYKKVAFRTGLIACRRVMTTLALRCFMCVGMMAAIKESLKNNKHANYLYEKFLKPTNKSPLARYCHGAFLFALETGALLLI